MTQEKSAKLKSRISTTDFKKISGMCDSVNKGQAYSCFDVVFMNLTNSERCVNFMDSVASKRKGASGGQNC